MESDESEYDIIIIGAGLSGLAAARFLLDVQPTRRLLILERDNHVGGPWSKSRTYPGFCSQSGLRLSGFSDAPLTVPPQAEVFNDIFEARYVTEYLESYIDSHVYCGRSLRERIKPGFEVTRIRKVESESWSVTGTFRSSGGGGKGGKEETEECRLTANQVIVATGITSEPKIPSFLGASNFDGRILHQTDYGRYASQKPPEQQQCQKVAVLGGGKSAADTVYGLVKAGHEVHWIIRRTGSGPGAFTNPADTARGPFLNDPELAATRLFATLSPQCYEERDTIWTWFLHRTGLGNKIVDAFWNSAVRKCKEVGDFQNRAGALEGFEGLESTVDLFWLTGPFGMIQRPDFWDTVARNVHVHRKDIARLEEGRSIVFEDGTSLLPIDILICCTGFQTTYRFFDEQQRIRLGLPHVRTPDDEDEKTWTTLEAAAAKDIVQRYPKLAAPPHFQHAASKPSTLTPTRMYHHIAPLHDPTIAFLGNVIVPNGFRIAEVQAIWTTAYLDNKLRLPPASEMQLEIARVTAYIKRRYPKQAELGDNCILYESMGYVDKLLSDVGLSSHRKGWWADLVYPVVVKYLSGTTREYLEKHGGGAQMADVG